MVNVQIPPEQAAWLQPALLSAYASGQLPAGSAGLAALNGELVSHGYAPLPGAAPIESTAGPPSGQPNPNLPAPPAPSSPPAGSAVAPPTTAPPAGGSPSQPAGGGAVGPTLATSPQPPPGFKPVAPLPYIPSAPPPQGNYQGLSGVNLAWSSFRDLITGDMPGFYADLVEIGKSLR